MENQPRNPEIDVGFTIEPNPAYIKALVQQQTIPLQKKFMLAALKSLCLSCEHCEYCPKKTEEIKCQRFMRYYQEYQNLLLNELL